MDNQTATTPKHFSLNDGPILPAGGFGAPWNGFATPIVTRETAEAIVVGSEEFVSFDFDANGVLTVTEPHADEDNPVVIVPDAAGLYALAPLGWVFEYENAVVTCPTSTQASTIIGCGSLLRDERDDEGLIHCPNCGIFFNPDLQVA